jgi:hypothetical protein
MCRPTSLKKLKVEDIATTTTTTTASADGSKGP